MYNENEFAFTYSFYQENCIIARFRPDRASSFFKGHFPDFPIMPGVLLVELVCKIFAKAQKIARNKITIHNLKKMKFVQPVLPDQEVEIQICFSENEMRVEAFSCEQQAFSFVSNFSLKLQIGN